MTHPLILKKEWFDKTLSGEKTEEYRDIKMHYVLRFLKVNKVHKYCDNTIRSHWAFGTGLIGSKRESLKYLLEAGNISFKPFTAIQFTNGYGNHRPRFTIECLGITIGKGNKDWGAPDEEVFIIKLGRILNKTNI